MILFNTPVVLFPLNKSTHHVVSRAVCDGHIILPAYEDAVRLAHKAGGGSALVAAPPIDVVMTLEGNKDGKAQTHAWLNKKGMQKYAVRRYTSSGKDLNYSLVRYPVVVKPIMGGGGRDVYVARNARELSKVRKHMRRERIIVEEALDARREWSLHFSAYRGNMTGTMCVRFDFADQFGIRKTRTTQFVNVTAESCPSPVLEATQLFVHASKYHGVGCLSGKFKGPQFKLLDINPRVCNMASRYDQGRFMRSFLLLMHKESTRVEANTKQCERSPK